MALNLKCVGARSSSFFTVLSRSLCMNKVENKYDVIISGGGMVGVAAACALGMSPMMAGKKILLTEAGSLRPPNKSSETCSNRVSALSPSTKQFMESVGVWDIIARKRYQPVKRMQVWDACSDGMITFNFADMQKDVAYIVENNVIVQAFIEQLEKLKDRVEVLDRVRIDRYELPKKEMEDVIVHMKDGTTYKTKLLIGADGTKSLVRDSMEINYVNWSYKQMAIVATLHLSESTENNVAWQRFLPDSTVALLPLTSNLSSLVWSTSIPHAKHLLNISNEEFVDAVNHALWEDKLKDPNVNALTRTFSGLLGRIFPEGTSVRQLPPSIINIDNGSRAAFVLGLGHATYYVANRVALVGDAAHRVHPHAGLGANLGFGDVACLIKILDDAVHRGCDIGSLVPLTKYEEERQQDAIPVMAAIDGLHRIFKTDFKPAVFLRNIGLQCVNAAYPLKEYLMQKI